jgi:hypothetical protein
VGGWLVMYITASNLKDLLPAHTLRAGLMMSLSNCQRNKEHWNGLKFAYQ